MGQLQADCRGGSLCDAVGTSAFGVTCRPTTGQVKKPLPYPLIGQKTPKDEMKAGIRVDLKQFSHAVL